MILCDTEAREIIDRTLALASADEVRVNLSGGRRGNTRFALNSATTCGDVDSLSLAVTASFGSRHATATTSEVGDQALRRVVATAEELARVAPEDPEHVPELGPQEYLAIDPCFEATVNATPELRAEAVAGAIEAGETAGLTAFGYYEHGHGFAAVGNNKGLFTHGRSSDASFTVTMRTADGAASGWARDNARDIGQVDCTGASQRAVQKALAARDLKPLEPGVYPVILEPSAAADFLAYAAYSLDARAADEGRSFFAKPGGGTKIGEKIVGDNITIRSDPTCPDILAEPFHGDGLPTRKNGWIEAGVLRQLVYSRYWAQKQGKQPTGAVTGLIVEGGEGTVDDLIRATDRAVLVTRFWYIRFVDPQTILVTGLTRDGTFWVEDGAIRHAVNNFRFNESPIALLNKVTAMSRPERVGRALVPAIKAGEFTLSSVSESV